MMAPVWNRALRSLLVPAMLSSSLCGCVHGAGEERPDTPRFVSVAEASLVWPDAPAEPKIAWLGAFASAEDLSDRTSLFQRLGRLISGAAPERFVRPTAVAARGDLLAVADPGRPALFIVDLPAARFRAVTHGDDGPLVSPVAVAFGRPGEVYLADSATGRVHRYDSDGKLLSTLGVPELERPTGLAYDETSGHLHVVDTAHHRVLTYDADGALVRVFGSRGNSDGAFNWPGTVTTVDDGDLMVVDTLNFRVQALGPKGEFRFAFGQPGDGSGDFSRPKGVAVDSFGHLYVVDALFDVVQIFDERGKFLMDFGGQGTGDGRFWLPNGIAIDERDRIYVCDSYNARVQAFQFLPGAALP